MIDYLEYKDDIIIDITYYNVPSDLDLKNFNNVISLRCSYNGIKTIFNFNYLLKTLNCSYNKIKYLDDLPNTIENLFCCGNPLINLNNLPNSIKILYCCNISTFHNLDCLPNSVEEVNLTNSNIQIKNIVSSLKTIKKNNINKEELFYYKKYSKENKNSLKIIYFKKI